MTSLNVVALVSGGKDSYFSMLHCIAQGHRIVALANLHPELRRESAAVGTSSLSVLNQAGQIASSGEYEADGMESFMYQTAGHTIVPAQAKALRLPLFRKAIDGIAADSSRDYHHRASSGLPAAPSLGEETECLTSLLREVLHSKPEVNAVCSGAILSSYQRTRIESVAVRLGLIPLSYLWQYPVLPDSSGAALLDDMYNMDFDIRFVKLASTGLDASMLWSNLMDKTVRLKIERTMAKYGGNILGEGGEYETLVLRGRSPVWQGQLTVDESQMQASTEPGGTSSLLFAPQSAHVNFIGLEEDDSWLDNLRMIPLWDRRFVTVREQLLHRIPHTDTTRSTKAESADVGQHPEQIWQLKGHRRRDPSFIYLNNMCSPDIGSANVTQQMESLNRIIRARLKGLGRHPNGIVFTTIILRSVAQDFAAVNRAYGELFDNPNPPARVTLASQLPEGVDVVLSVIVSLGPKSASNGLHVQSRSYWAPANIGPYSQAIAVKLSESMTLIFVSGQIPLVPATMIQLKNDTASSDASNRTTNFLDDVCLSLQHMWRIGTQMKVSWWAGVIVFISANADASTRAASIFDVWKRIHDVDLWTSEEEDEEPSDPWDVKYGNMKAFATHTGDSDRLPDFQRRISKGSIASLPGIFVAEVGELPRASSVEWQGLGLADVFVTFEKSKLHGFDATLCSIRGTEKQFTFISVIKRDEDNSSLRDLIAKLHREDSSHMTIYTTDYRCLEQLDAQVVPCISVWAPSTQGAKSLMAGIVLHSWSKQGDG